MNQLSCKSTTGWRLGNIPQSERRNEGVSTSANPEHFQNSILHTCSCERSRGAACPRRSGLHFIKLTEFMKKEHVQNGLNGKPVNWECIDFVLIYTRAFSVRLNQNLQSRFSRFHCKKSTIFRKPKFFSIRKNLARDAKLTLSRPWLKRKNNK